ncbi:MAG: type IV secretory system conjugative DNA transfer family protein [Clostridia bacterium]|nr:type IV secretory system conjugative DNA transfer family protein [Clostridia bacterium]
MKRIAKRVLKYLIILVVAYPILVVAVSYFSTGMVRLSVESLTSPTTLLLTIVVVGGFVVYDLLRFVDGKGKKKKGDKAEDKVKDTSGQEISEFFNRDFVTEKTLEEVSGFNYNTLSTIKQSKKDGILVRAEAWKGGLEINFVEPIHALVVGTTSSGKTSRFVVPSLQLMSMTAAKPSFVITDPKGELFEKCSAKFEQEGYDVKIVDLRNPFGSVQWNPLSYPYDLYTRSFELEKEVKVHMAGDNPKRYNLISQRDFDYNASTWFEFDGIAYADKDVLESDLKVMARDLKDKTYTALSDICSTLAPVENTKDPTWEKTAQRLIHAVMLAMLEDSRIPELGMTRERYNLYNVYKICNMTDGGRDTYATLKKYLFDYRDKFSKVNSLASTALNNADTTSKNYMGFVSSKTVLFSDSGISFLTARTDIDFVHMDEKPTALFLIIPDEVRTRYPLAILFVSQLYTRLVEKAQRLGGELKRHVYFMLDEFGNMPKFPNFGTSMSVGRARGIFFELCVQSYSQLYQVYGQEEGKIIKDNCPIQVYISSEDTVTNKEFSELLGKKTISVTNENKSKGPDGKTTTSTSTQIKSIPVAYPEELPTFKDQGFTTIKTFNPNAALKTKITPYFDSEVSHVYSTKRTNRGYQRRHIFDENAIYYDIKERNNLMAKQNGEDEDDDLF